MCVEVIGEKVGENQLSYSRQRKLRPELLQANISNSGEKSKIHRERGKVKL